MIDLSDASQLERIVAKLQLMTAKEKSEVELFIDWLSRGYDRRRCCAGDPAEG